MPKVKLPCATCPDLKDCQTAWEIYVLGTTLQEAGAKVEAVNLTCPKVQVLRRLRDCPVRQVPRAAKMVVQDLQTKVLAEHDTSQREVSVKPVSTRRYTRQGHRAPKAVDLGGDIVRDRRGRHLRL